MNKFFSTSLYFVKGYKRPFFHQRDARFYCEDHGLDWKTAVTKFDSRKEYERWGELRGMEERGEIRNLRRQVEFELIPKQTEQIPVRKKKAIWEVCHLEQFRTRAEAVAYCRKEGLKIKDSLEKVVTTVVEHNSRTIEQSAVYTADFVYEDIDGNAVVEDVKSAYTKKEKDYVLRRKLMLFIHGIKIKEI